MRGDFDSRILDSPGCFIGGGQANRTDRKERLLADRWAPSVAIYFRFVTPVDPSASLILLPLSVNNPYKFLFVPHVRSFPRFRSMARPAVIYLFFFAFSFSQVLVPLRYCFFFCSILHHGKNVDRFLC